MTGLEWAAERELATQMIEGRIRGLASAFAFAPSTEAPWQAAAHAVKAGVELGRELVQLRDAGRISASTIDLLFDALDDGVGRMIELMP